MLLIVGAGVSLVSSEHPRTSGGMMTVMKQDWVGKFYEFSTVPDKIANDPESLTDFWPARTMVSEYSLPWKVDNAHITEKNYRSGAEVQNHSVGGLLICQKGV